MAMSPCFATLCINGESCLAKVHPNNIHHYGFCEILVLEFDQPGHELRLKWLKLNVLMMM